MEVFFKVILALVKQCFFYIPNLIPLHTLYEQKVIYLRTVVGLYWRRDVLIFGQINYQVMNLKEEVIYKIE